MTDLDTGHRDDLLGWGALAVVGAGAVVAVAQRVLEIGPQRCALRVLAGVPCPFCGMSTVAVQMLQGDLVGALRADLLGTVFLVVIGVVALGQLARQWRPRVPRLPAGATIVAASGVLLGHWLMTLTGVVELAPLE